VLVDNINARLRETSMHWSQAVIEGGVTRFRPVVLTSATTFMGLLPIQLEQSIQAEFVKPMAISIAFGVLFATGVTLFLVPSLYFVGRDIRGLLSREESPPGPTATATPIDAQPEPDSTADAA
jgi:multidrug efflux pump subunit AcrB